MTPTPTETRGSLADVFPDDGGVELGFEVMAYLLMPPKGRKAIHLRGGTQTGKSAFIRNFVEGVMDLDCSIGPCRTLKRTTLRPLRFWARH